MANPNPTYKKPGGSPKSAKELRAASKKEADAKAANAAHKKAELSDIHISKAQQIKEEFENRMEGLKENIQAEPIKQEPGESIAAFRKRQKKQNDESLDNIKDRSLVNIAGTRARTEANKQMRNAKNYGKEQARVFLKSHPNANKAIEAAKERSKAIQDKIAKIQNTNAAKRLAALKKYYNAKEHVKRQIRNEIKKKAAEFAARVAAQVARSIAVAILEAIIAIVTFIASISIEVILAVVVIIVIVIYIDEVCNANSITSAVCNAVADVANWLSSVYDYIF